MSDDAPRINPSLAASAATAAFIRDRQARITGAMLYRACVDISMCAGKCEREGWLLAEGVAEGFERKREDRDER